VRFADPLRPDHGSTPVPIVRSPRGAVSRCPCCGHLHVEFGNAFLMLRPGGLRRLRRIVAELREDETEVGGDVERAILRTGEDTAFAFDPTELRELHALLTEVERALPRP